MPLEAIERLQATEFEILTIFDAYCRAHNLQYYLIGGALLGAARYGRFIPWDDDVDVAMPREDYERLAELWETTSIQGYFLQSAKTDPFFARGIMKLRKEGTELIEESCANVKMHRGIYIDIFPIDYASVADGKVLARKAKRIRRLLSFRAIRSGYIGRKHAFLKRVIRGVTLSISLTKIDNRLYKEATEYNSGERNYAVLWLHNYDWTHQIHPVAVLGTEGGCDFCGRRFMAPENIDAFLSKVFGEKYMEEPPKEKQKNPHRYLSFRC